LFEAALQQLGIKELPWEEYSGGFEMLVASSAPIYWSLCLLTGIAVFRLRANEHSIERPFQIPLYPLPPLIFCGTCGYMLWASLAYARWLVLLGLIPIVLGSLVYIIVRTINSAR
jgi:amino acid transporter